MPTGNPFSPQSPDWYWYQYDLTPEQRYSYDQQQRENDALYRNYGSYLQGQGYLGSSYYNALGDAAQGYYGAMGQIGAANAGARGQIGAAYQAADASKYGSQLSYLAQLESLKNALERAQLESTDKRYTAELGSQDTRYSADRNLLGRQYEADATRYGNYDVANINSNANMYGSLLGYQGTLSQSDAARYAADQRLQEALASAGAQRYGSDTQLRGQLAGFGSNERIAGLNTVSAERIAQLNNQSAQEVAKLNNLAPLLGEVLRQKRARAALQLISPLIGNIGGYIDRLPWFHPASTEGVM